MRLINGDSLTVLDELDEKSVECVVTSPPYFNVKDYSHWETYTDYLKWLETIFKKIFLVLKDGRMCCVNISSIIIPRVNRSHESKRLPLPFHFVNLMGRIGFKFLEDIIWVKPNSSVPNRNGGFYRHRKPVAYKPNLVNEYIFVFQKPCDCLIDNILRSYDDDIVTDSLIGDGYERTNVWSINPVHSKNHPAVFPYEIPYRLVEYYTFIGDTVLDPFMGIGTTGKVCKDLNRDFIGVELNKEYFMVAKESVK